MSIIDRHLKEGPSYSQHTVSKEVVLKEAVAKQLHASGCQEAVSLL